MNDYPNISAYEDARTDTDAIVIGAGLGGLLAAANLLQRGRRVIVLERGQRSGGRFTAKNFRGVQISTGAVHMVPFGSGGVLAQMLARLKVPHRLLDADVFGSFHVHGKQYRARGLLGICQFLTPYQIFCFLRIGYLMFIRPLPEHEQTLPFDLWLKRYINIERNPQLFAFFQSISRFALSLELGQVSVAEVIRITKNMLRYTAPAIVQGGCGALTNQLEKMIIAQGGEIRLAHEVTQILCQDNHVTGVSLRNKTTNEETILTAPLIISDIGPQATYGAINCVEMDSAINCADAMNRVPMDTRDKSPNSSCRAKDLSSQPQVASQEADPQQDGNALLHRARFADGSVRTSAQLSCPTGAADLGSSPAVGLKVHILSDISLIPHKGIMYCLETKRIAGIVQPTNSDPSLAPAGKHLLITHQVIQSNNVEEERALALADLRMLFGEAFDRHCRVLTMGIYRGEWPVNRATQGKDVNPQTNVAGLYLVGDAVKPLGYLMVEGVAQSVNCLVDHIDKRQPSVPTKRLFHKPLGNRPWLNVIRWLWKAPGNSGK